jgi:Flp pilus assembly pilin Flp
MLKLYTKVQVVLQSLKDESGQDTVEYAILTGLIVVGAIASVKTIGAWVLTQFSTLAAAL